MGNGDWELQDVPHLREALRSGESILWYGRPRRASYIVRQWPQSFFGALFLGFSLFWTAAAYFGTRHSGGDMGVVGAFFPLFGLPFILIGSALTFGHYLVAAAEWPNVEYALTNQRVLIQSGRTPTLASTELSALATVTATGVAVGSVSFAREGGPAVPPSVRRFAVGAGGMRVASALGPVFECISDPRHVLMLAEDAIQKARNRKDT